MKNKDEFIRAYRQELRDLAAKAFPKTCNSCGAEYRDLDEFLAKTESIPRAHGLMEMNGLDGGEVVDLIRNCDCGSTLMVVFEERRDGSSTRPMVRKLFGLLLDHLKQRGVEEQEAREELLNVLYGRESQLVENEANRHPEFGEMFDLLKGLPIPTDPEQNG